MKILTYKINGHTSVYNPKTKEVERQESIATVTVECPTKASYDANYPIEEKEAIPGTIEVSGEFDAEPDAAPTLEERVGTVEDDVADLSEALDMILNEVTE